MMAAVRDVRAQRRKRSEKPISVPRSARCWRWELSIQMPAASSSPTRM